MQQVEIYSFQAFGEPDKEMEYPSDHSALDLSPLYIHLPDAMGKIRR